MRKVLINTAGLLACLLSSTGLQATTILTFEVIAEHTEKAFGKDTPINNLGTKTFLLDLVLDEFTFTHTNIYDTPYPGLVEYYNLSTAALVSASALSEDAKTNFMTSYGFGDLSPVPSDAPPNPLHWNKARIEGGKAIFEDTGRQFANINRRWTEVQESPTVDGPEGWLDRYIMLDFMQLHYEMPIAIPDLELNTFDMFEAMLASLLFEEELFEFSSSALLEADWCTADYLVCASAASVWNGTPYSPPYGEGWVEFQGSATLIDISTVPVPGTAWLMLLALGGLVGYRQRH